MMTKTSLLVLAAVAGAASAQTASETINLGDIAALGADGFFTSGQGIAQIDTSGLDFGQNFVAWRVRSDWSSIGGGSFSSESSVFLGDPSVFQLITPAVAAVNGVADANPVNGLTFAGGFNAGNAPALPLIDVVFDSGVFGDANFNNSTLELFTASDLPSTVINPGARSANAPANFVDLGTIANVGDSFSINTFASTFDTEIGVYAADGTLISNNDDAGGTLQSEVNFGGGVSVAPDGTISFAEFGAGEYFIAVSEFDTLFGDDFDVAGGLEDGEAFDVFIEANGVTGESSIALDLANGIDDGVAYFRFEIVPAPGAAALLGLGGLLAARRRRA
ncbi:MAG: hypothetical protein AAF995_08870 [Planctomycetota bacterium]